MGGAFDVDLVVRGATCATLAGPKGARQADAMGDVRLEEDWTVAASDGIITWSGPDADWRGTAHDVVHAEGRLLTPGFVDGHTHLVYGGDRAFELGMKLAGKSYMEILAAGGGIMHTVRETRRRTLKQLHEEATPRLRRMARAGTTTFESKSGYGLDTQEELKMLAASELLATSSGATFVHTFLGAHAVPAEFKGRSEAYVDAVIDDMMPAVRQQGIATFCDAFVEKDVFTVEQGARILAAAKRLGLKTRLHADEIVNIGGAELAAKAGCVSADHLLRISDAGIEALANAGTIATLMPTVPITLAKPEWAPAKRMLDAGIPLALATDHNPNNPVVDMGLVCQLACFAMGLTPAQAITAATWNGAVALGVDADVGSIEVGKRADLVLHDVPDLDHWIAEFGRSTAADVFLAGRRF